MNLFYFLIFTILLVIESLVSQTVLDGFLDSECGKVEFKLLSFFYFKYSIKFLLHKRVQIHQLVEYMEV
jgi:hypothetical protein